MIQHSGWWLFLVVLPPIYWLLPVQWRSWLIAISSIGLLAIFVAWDLLLMLGLGALVYFAYHTDPRKSPDWLMRAAKSTLPFWAVLAYFVWSKYLPSLGRIVSGQGSFLDFAVPLGVSYFSFKLLHYVIEMRRGNFKEHKPEDFFAWLFLAPIFTAGPIERFDHYMAERRIDKFQSAFIVEGILRISIGLVKKFFFGVIVLAIIKDQSNGGLLAMSQNLDSFSSPVIWMVLFLTLSYVYLDFSAYSDIAIGSSRLFGLKIMENFNLPFLATSLQKFWQRWHMTLANWCRSYIYMTMIGLTRNPYWAVIATFTTMGVWHSAGPHWVIWGVWHGVGLAVLLHWGRIAAKRKIKFFKTRPGALVGWAGTMSYVALGGAFTALHNQAPVTQSMKIILAALGIRI